MYLFFTPTVNGQTFDVQQSGGFVDVVQFFDSPALDGVPVSSVEGSIPVGNGSYRFDIPDQLLPLGRYWSRVGWRIDQFADVTFQSAGTVDFPSGPYAPVAVPEDMAVLLGFDLPLSTAVKAQLVECISDAKSVVELAIGSIVPIKLVLRAAVYDEDSALDKSLPSTWFSDTTEITIESWLNNFDGTYDVTYWYGFDGRKEEPIKRFVVRYAAAWWRKAFGGDQSFGQFVTSVSTEGQSVSYSSTQRAADVDPALGMSLEALVKRYGSASASSTVGVYQRRNQTYGYDRTFWSGDGYVWPEYWG